VHRSRSVRRVDVTTNAQISWSHAGTALLCELADRHRVDQGHVVTMVDCGISWKHPRPGRRATHLAVAIADGATVSTTSKRSSSRGRQTS